MIRSQGACILGKKDGGYGKAAKTPLGVKNNFGTGSLCLFSRTSAKAPNCALVGLNVC